MISCAFNFFLLREYGFLIIHGVLVSCLCYEHSIFGSQGERLQKILHIYLESSDATLNLLNDVACSIFPQVIIVPPIYYVSDKAVVLKHFIC